MMLCNPFIIAVHDGISHPMSPGCRHVSSVPARCRSTVVGTRGIGTVSQLKPSRHREPIICLDRAEHASIILGLIELLELGCVSKRPWLPERFRQRFEPFPYLSVAHWAHSQS